MRPPPLIVDGTQAAPKEGNDEEKLLAGYAEKHNGYWRAVLSWQDSNGEHRKTTKEDGIKFHPD